MLGLRLARLADRDLLHIVDVVSDRDAGVAGQSLDRIDRAILMLRDFPEAGVAAPHLGRGRRTFAVPPWTIHYRATPDRLMVIRLLDGRRRPR